MFYTYILRCTDETLYTGYCRDIKKRLQEHMDHSPAAAKYTRARKVVGVEALWKSSSRSEAMRLEALIKHLPRAKKLFLIQNPASLSELFSEKLDAENYEVQDLLFLKEKQAKELL